MRTQFILVNLKIAVAVAAVLGIAAGTPAIISDAVHGAGNPHFYFLAPMVSTPPAPTGVFDAEAAPVVRIDKIDGNGNVIMSVAAFTPRVTGQAYTAIWHTNDYDLDPYGSYRVKVFVNNNLVGFADIALVESGAHNVDTGSYVPVIQGSSLAIRFRVEQGATAMPRP